MNVIGTIPIVEAADRLHAPRMVLSNSAAVYGAPVSPLYGEDSYQAPLSTYGAGKPAAEPFVHAVGQHLDVSTVARRHFHVFDPLQYPASDYAEVVPAWVIVALRGDRRKVNGDRGSNRDLIYVGDVVSATLIAGDSKASDRLDRRIASDGVSASLSCSTPFAPPADIWTQ